MLTKKSQNYIFYKKLLMVFFIILDIKNIDSFLNYINYYF